MHPIARLPYVRASGKGDSFSQIGRLRKGTHGDASGQDVLVDGRPCTIKASEDVMNRRRVSDLKLPATATLVGYLEFGVQDRVKPKTLEKVMAALI